MAYKFRNFVLQKAVFRSQHTNLGVSAAKIHSRIENDPRKFQIFE